MSDKWRDAAAMARFQDNLAKAQFANAAAAQEFYKRLAAAKDAKDTPTGKK